MQLHGCAVVHVVDGLATCCKFLWKPNLKVLPTKTDEFPSNIRFHNFYCAHKSAANYGNSSFAQYAPLFREPLSPRWPAALFANFPMHIFDIFEWIILGRLLLIKTSWREPKWKIQKIQGMNKFSTLLSVVRQVERGDVLEGCRWNNCQKGARQLHYAVYLATFSQITKYMSAYYKVNFWWVLAHCTINFSTFFPHFLGSFDTSQSIFLYTSANWEG